MDVTAAQPTVGGRAVLATPLSVPDTWGAASWCGDSGRLLIFGVAASRVYELTIPTLLSATWPVDSHAVSGLTPRQHDQRLAHGSAHPLHHAAQHTQAAVHQGDGVPPGRHRPDAVAAVVGQEQGPEGMFRWTGDRTVLRIPVPSTGPLPATS